MTFLNQELPEDELIEQKRRRTKPRNKNTKQRTLILKREKRDNDTKRDYDTKRDNDTKQYRALHSHTEEYRKTHNSEEQYKEIQKSTEK